MMMKVLFPLQERYYSVNGLWERIGPPQQVIYHFVTGLWAWIPLF
jgi:hypothetical protein